MGPAIDPLGPGAGWQEADNARAGYGAAPIGRRGLDDADEIPARPPAGLGLLQSAPRLTAVERDRAHPHRHLVTVAITQLNRFD